MIKIRKSGERGSANLGWLTTYHTFSFNDYHDPRYTRFRTLRVLNEDHVEPDTGFPEHFHRDMEILTYVYAGAIRHADNIGNQGVVQAGQVQRMTAGSGIMHSEYNASSDEVLSLLQIWVFPERKALTPGYEQKTFPAENRKNRLRLFASRDGREGSLTLHQDADFYDSLLLKDVEVKHMLEKSRGAWVQAISGSLTLNDSLMGAGDGASVEGESVLTFRTENSAEFILIDLG